MNLLNTFKPKFFRDKNEPIKVCNADLFFKNRIIQHDDTISGHVIEKDGKIYLYYFLSYHLDAGMDFWIISIDGHPNDIEYVIIEIDSINNITGICYLPHSTSEHFWIRNKEDMNILFDGNTTNVYISKGKHSMYPVPKVYRYALFGTDVCNNPEECIYTIVPLTKYLLETTHFQDGCIGFPKKLSKNLLIIPEIRLSTVSRRLVIKKIW